MCGDTQAGCAPSQLKAQETSDEISTSVMAPGMEAGGPSLEGSLRPSAQRKWGFVFRTDRVLSFQRPFTYIIASMNDSQTERGPGRTKTVSFGHLRFYVFNCNMRVQHTALRAASRAARCKELHRRPARQARAAPRMTEPWGTRPVLSTVTANRQPAMEGNQFQRSLKS